MYFLLHTNEVLRYRWIKLEAEAAKKVARSRRIVALHQCSEQLVCASQRATFRLGVGFTSLLFSIVTKKLNENPCVYVAYCA